MGGMDHGHSLPGSDGFQREFLPKLPAVPDSGRFPEISEKEQVRMFHLAPSTASGAGSATIAGKAHNLPGTRQGKIPMNRLGHDPGNGKSGPEDPTLEETSSTKAVRLSFTFGPGLFNSLSFSFLPRYFTAASLSLQ